MSFSLPVVVLTSPEPAIMHISSWVSLPFPRALVYPTYRDKLVELTPYLGNVRDIEVKERHRVEQGLDMVLIWHGGGEIPAAARALLSDAMLSWTDHTHWDDQNYLTLWRIEPHAFTEAVHCHGRNIFLEDGEQTVIKSDGELVIDPGLISGVPSFLSGMVAKAVEDYLSQKIEPNFRQLAQGVETYLAQQQAL